MVLVVPARLEVRSAVAAVRTMAKSSYAAGAIDAAAATMHWHLEIGSRMLLPSSIWLVVLLTTVWSLRFLLPALAGSSDMPEEFGAMLCKSQSGKLCC